MAPLFLFIALISLVQGQTTNIANPDLRCYMCESRATNACETYPMDPVAVQSVECSSVPFPKWRENERTFVQQILGNSTDGKFKGGPILEEVFSSPTGDNSFKYYCAKVALVKGDLKSTVRSCVPVRTDVKDVCDFLRQKIPEPLQIKSCYACDTDRCNSSPRMFTSYFALFFGSVFMVLQVLFLKKQLI